MTSETHYPVGTKVTVDLEVVEVDNTILPYNLESKCKIDGESFIDVWLTEEQLQKRIQEEIDKIQKELEELNNG